MKLSWRDAVTTLFALSGGAIVYAKFYDYSWALLGSWRNAIAALAVLGIGMFVASNFDFTNGSWLNLGEMALGSIALVLAVVGTAIASQPLFYLLAVILGVLWFVDTARHVRHSLLGDTIYHRHVHVH